RNFHHGGTETRRRQALACFSVSLCLRGESSFFPTAPGMLTILFDGIAYGMLLFVLAVGLSVTLGVMNVINLAHGAFAMAGGYAAVVLVNRWGVPFLAALPLAALASAA